MANSHPDGRFAFLIAVTQQEKTRHLPL